MLTSNPRALRSNTNLKGTNNLAAAFPEFGKQTRRHAVPKSGNVGVSSASSSSSVSRNFYGGPASVEGTHQTTGSFSTKRNAAVDDDDSGLSSHMKRVKIGEGQSTDVPGADDEVSVPAFEPAPSVLEAYADHMEDDDLDGNIPFKKSAPVEILAPVEQKLEDDASDYFASDIEESEDRSTPMSKERRKVRGDLTIARMSSYFKTNYPVPAVNIFQANGDPPFWYARLRKFNEEENRWVEKGPVVILIVPCRPEAPWEARVVAHFTFGTQSAAVNMPITAFHANAIVSKGRRALVSSFGCNIIGKAFITQQPRKLREVLAPLNTKDTQRLMEAEGIKTTDAMAALPAEIASRMKKSKSKINVRHSEGSSENSSPERSSILNSSSVGAGNSDYLYECRTTVVGVKEEGCSLFVFRFESSKDTASFHERFVRASSDYDRSLAEQRLMTFMTPQPKQRNLLSGQLVAGGPDQPRFQSPFAGNVQAAQALADSGLIYVPVSSDAVAAATLGQASKPMEHRFICWHCRASVACNMPLVPSVERIMEAHREHPNSTRWDHPDAEAKARKIRTGYRCPYAFNSIGAGGMFEANENDAPMRKAKRSRWDPIVLGDQ
ncbi:hypothetical protein HDU97_006641 [Phlyctochytrium planicorne]|nr:hypothetical protein HDU97_006641 [Phlyctochytrium planicorne]